MPDPPAAWVPYVDGRDEAEVWLSAATWVRTQHVLRGYNQPPLIVLSPHSTLPSLWLLDVFESLPSVTIMAKLEQVNVPVLAHHPDSRTIAHLASRAKDRELALCAVQGDKDVPTRSWAGLVGALDLSREEHPRVRDCRDQLINGCDMKEARQLLQELASAGLLQPEHLLTRLFAEGADPWRLKFLETMMYDLLGGRP